MKYIEAFREILSFQNIEKYDIASITSLNILSDFYFVLEIV